MSTDVTEETLSNGHHRSSTPEVGDMDIHTQACARVMPQQFKPAPGVEVFDGVYLGKMLGAGVQAKVFDLVFKDGSQTGKVLKIGHQDLSHSLLLNKMATSMMSLQKEWEIGMQLKAALEDKDGNLPGFTRTCDCMAIMKDAKSKSVTFRGMMMEKIQGWSVASRVTDPTFHNIHYIREMLYQVFSALDRAQRYLGFNHADLGLNNVMEHYPRILPSLVEKQKQENLRVISSTNLAGMDSVSSPKEPGKEPTWTRTESGMGCAVPPPVPGYSCAFDGGKLPLGPHIEFKIIDYGVGEFNETLAQAAGGYTADETLRKIHHVFSQRGIPVGPNANEELLNLVQEEDPGINAGEKKKKKKKKRSAWMLRKDQDNRFVVMEGDSMKKNAKEKEKSRRQTTSVSKGPIEKMYRRFWERKGDVFHILLSLAVTLDDRVWPKEDEKDVQLFISLIHHVTGVKMKAYFVSPTDPKRIKVMGRRWKESEESAVEEGYRPYLYGTRVRFFNKMRKFRMVLSAHFAPFNSGLLAGEALVSPFFGTGGAKHATLPVCVESAFPFREVA